MCLKTLNVVLASRCQWSISLDPGLFCADIDWSQVLVLSLCWFYVGVLTCLRWLGAAPDML